MDNTESIFIKSFTRRLGMPIFVPLLALAIAIIGAGLVRNSPGIDGVNLFVETLSGRSSSLFGGLGILAPLGYAFTLGVAAAFNPCGFVLLPGYIGLYLGNDGSAMVVKENALKQLGKALLVGCTVTLGFILLFGVAGAAIGLGARAALSSILPWAGFSIGTVLLLTGGWMLTGRTLSFTIAQQLAAEIDISNESGMRGYFLFGLSYGIASLSCALPLFMGLMVKSISSGSILSALIEFVSYALGMGLVVITLTLALAFSKGAVIAVLRKGMLFFQPLGAWLMIAAGAYIVFYWLSIGALIG